MRHFSAHYIKISAATLCGCLFPALAHAVEKSSASTQAIGSIVQVLIGLFAVLVVIILVAAYLRKTVRLQFAGTGVIKLLSSVSLSPRERVILLQVGDEQVLVGLSATGLRKLHVLTHPVKIETELAQSAHASNLTNSIAERLLRLLQGKPRA